MELVNNEKNNEQENNEILLIFRFFHYIWFISSENLYFILNLKDKMARL